VNSDRPRGEGFSFEVFIEENCIYKSIKKNFKNLRNLLFLKLQIFRNKFRTPEFPYLEDISGKPNSKIMAGLDQLWWLTDSKVSNRMQGQKWFCILVFWFCSEGTIF